MLEPAQSDLIAMEVATLRGLAEQALLAQRGEATLDVEALSARLRDVATRGGPPELGGVLLELLHSGVLATVRDTRGRSCRALAVKALLKLDGPEAQSLSEADLASARKSSLAAPLWVVIVSAALTTLGGLGALVVSLGGPVLVGLAFHKSGVPPFTHLLVGLTGGLTAWRAARLVIHQEPRPTDLRALLLLASAGALLFLMDLPALREGGPRALMAPLLAAIPAASTAFFLRASGVRFRDPA